MRFLLYFALIISLSSCSDIVQGVTKEISDSISEKDSLAKLNEDKEDFFYYHILKEYKVIERKKTGSDSLYLARTYYTDGATYSDSWYKNELRDGLTTVYHPDGSVAVKFVFKNGMLYSTLEGFDTKGKAVDFGNLKNGTGKSIFYDPISDAKFSEFNYVDGKKNGDYINYYFNGRISEKGTYVDDLFQGSFLKYYKNGKVKEKANFYQGKMNGEHIVYFQSGALNQMEIWKNEKCQYAIEYDTKGLKTKEQKYQPADSSQVETTYIYGSNGNLSSKGQFKNGLKYGDYSYFYENAKIKSIETWKNDTLLKETAWYESGNLKSEGVYKNGELDSIYTEYYKDGKLRLQQQYKNGKKNGKYFSYYSNGQKYVIGNYSDNEPLGKFQYYTKEGVYKGENEFKIPKK